MGATEKLGSYVSNARYEDLPKEVIHQAKRCILDTIGCILSGYSTELGKNVISLAKNIGGGRGTSTIVGDGSKVSPLQAAFANASLADVLDWNDFLYVGHCGCGTIPAALAVGEEVHASGIDIITAVVMGYEVMGRIGLAVQPSEARFKQLWGVPSWVSFAAGAAAGKILDLNERQMTTTIGYAGAFAPVASSWKYVETRSDVYHCLHGWSTMGGVFASAHAKKNFVGMNTLLDGEHGWWVMVGSDRCNFPLMTRGLGKEYWIMKTMVKRFPSNLWIQPFLDAFYKAIEGEDVKAEDIEKILVTPGIPMLMPYKQVGMMDAEFSLPYNIAAAILERKPSYRWYAQEKLSDPNILNLMSRVETEQEMEFILPYQCLSKLWEDEWHYSATVTVITKHGKHLRGSVFYPRGHPRNPITEEELEEKIRNASIPPLGNKRCTKLISLVRRLEEIKDISELTAILSER